MPKQNGAPWGVVPPGGKITEHFYWNEAACRCCGKVGELEETRRQARFLENVRLMLGGKVLHVNSWWRCPQHNDRIGGAAMSLHIDGLATDITARHMGPKAVQNRMKKAQKDGTIGGVGCYASFTHVDRGPRRIWRG